MKTICVMQPYMFPYLGYFQLAKAVDEFWLFDCVQYIRRGWMNRNYLYDNREFKLFTLPVEKGSRSDLIYQKRFTNDYIKSINHLSKMLASIYAKQPYKNKAVNIVEHHADFYDEDRLFGDISYESLKNLFGILGIDTKLYRTSSLNIDPDVRGQERIIQVCREVEAKAYINPLGGQSLYNENEFLLNGVKLGFIKSRPSDYLYDICQEELVIDGAASILDFIARVSSEQYNDYLEMYNIEW